MVYQHASNSWKPKQNSSHEDPPKTTRNEIQALDFEFILFVRQKLFQRQSLIRRAATG